LSPAVKSAAEKGEKVLFHASVLVAYLRLHERRARTHPVFVTFSRLQNVHISSSYGLPVSPGVRSFDKRLLTADERLLTALG
jgi:hypothetical protein